MELLFAFEVPTSKVDANLRPLILGVQGLRLKWRVSTSEVLVGGN